MTRTVSLVKISTALALLVGCGSSQEAYYSNTTPTEEAAPEIYAMRSGGGPVSRDYFVDDAVEGSHGGGGDVTMSERAPSPDPRAHGSSSPTTVPSSAPPATSADSAAVVTVDEVTAPTSPSVTVDIDGALQPVPTPTYQQQVVVAQLTAASVGDVDRRGPYLSYLTRHPSERIQTNLDMTRRIRFRVLDAASRPVHDVAISFTAGGQRVEGRTHADGYWDFFPGVSAPAAQGSTQVSIQRGNQQAQATVNIPAQGDARDIVIQLPQSAAVAPSTLDLAFAIDVTGSMGDELAYVNHEVQGIVQRVRAAVNQVNVRVAATFYRDRGDMQPLQQIQFTNNVAGFNAQMAQITAGGGGDYPEDMNAGLQSAITSLNWSTSQAVRVLVVIADAPPQSYPDSQYTFHHAMVDASRRGIRIMPVAASGSDRVVEYLFRAMGAFTSTPYVYLTNDSGIGGHHMEADTDRISVEMFSDLLTRMLISDLQGHGMHEPSHASQGQLLGFVQ